MKKNLQHLRNEYPAGQTPQTIDLNGCKYVIPYHYVKNFDDAKKAFVSDFFDARIKDCSRYAKNKAKYRKISWRDDSYKYSMPVPYILRDLKLSDSLIVSYIFNQAECKYNQAIWMTRELKKFFPEEEILTEISAGSFRNMRSRYCRFVVEKAKDKTVAAAIVVGEFLAHGIKKSTKNIKGLSIDKLKNAAQKYGARALIATAVLAAGVGTVKLFDSKKDKVENVGEDPYGNLKTFENVRDDIKVLLASVENFSPTAFPDGKGVLTIGYGCTFLIDENGVGNREISPIKKGMTMTMEEACVQKDRYLDFRILPQIKNLIKVPMDEETILMTAGFAYVIGPNGFKKSGYLKALNDGVKGEELFRHTTGWRQQKGLLKRNYLTYLRAMRTLPTAAFLDMPAEGCYSLEVEDCCLTDKRGRLKKDGNDLAYFKSDSLSVAENMTIIKRPRVSKQLGPCKKVRDILPQSLVQRIEKRQQAQFSLMQASVKSR